MPFVVPRSKGSVCRVLVPVRVVTRRSALYFLAMVLVRVAAGGLPDLSADAVQGVGG
jgi:hypothetical protein